MLNAFGNGITISSNIGTAPWGASEVNLAHIFHISIALSMFLVGCLVALANQLLLRRFDLPRFLGEVGFIACFSFFINLFTGLFSAIGLPDLALPWRLAAGLAGIMTLGCSISFYQRANLIMHPNDDTTNILRFLYCRNKVVRAQLINFSVPLLVTAGCWLATGKIYAVSIGTLLCLLVNGPMIALADRWLWPSLHHNVTVPKAISDRSENN
ncbi:membrane protein [Lactobacillus nasalidis]|uniref:Membrane protein n=1 Tax=Lactobacillus nasalidis TaxID=2797258 RepID=A0ABQ3W8N2_9LACO|nr:hypothetical protein [Lactobacillus nasalidis]GHV97122.1 membrane protein [Lactobacillus nasalidis]GHV99969.1 membrane protein [Lactobacillus nasalidis]GHW00547.1 membrane protein [Lactobacillus nasalidis]